MERRQYLVAAGSIASLGVAGCLGQAAEEGADPGDDPSSTPTNNPTLGKTLQAGDYTVELSRPRIRTSVLEAGTHVDVWAEPDTQFLVVTASSDGTAIDELPLSLVTEGTPIDRPLSFVGRPDIETDAAVAVPVPVAEYDTVTFVLEAGGESDRVVVPSSIVTTLGTAPAFTVTSLDVPASVTHGDSFEASFTVTNDGTRNARFLAEFGHGQISDTGEVSVTVPAGAERTHTETIEPYYESGPDAVPVVLDWGLDRRRVEVPVTNG